MAAGILRFLHSQLFVTPPEPTTSFTGKTIIVTGSNTGLGFEAARHFTRLDASRVILAVRSLEKGEAAKRDIERTTGRENVVQVRHLDMSSYQSVLDFASKISKELDRIDAAVLNAGVLRTNWEVFEQDESTITVNVVSTFLLSFALLPKLKETSKAFQVCPTLTLVASEVHEWATFSERHAPKGQIFAALNEQRRNGKAVSFIERYQVSKLIEILGVRALCASTSLPVTMNCVNPGLCHSEFGRESGGPLARVMAVMKMLLARSTEVGSRTLVHAAAATDSHGEYLSDSKVTPPRGIVLSEEGERVQQDLWDELVAKLEEIQKNITKV